MSDNRLGTIQRLLRNHWCCDAFDIEKLAGDAGTRVYYRSRCRSDSIVVMDRCEPYDSGTDTFVTLTRYLKHHELPVPAILTDYSGYGILFLEDLGDRTLQSEYGDAPETTMRDLYCKVLDILARMHVSCRNEGQSAPSAFTLRFDYEKLRWELDFFMLHYVRNHKKFQLPQADTRVLVHCFDLICRTLEKEPVVFSHRDFHSRNLMIKDSNVFMIDYQDARLGPPEYDLASLLRDAYVKLPEECIETCRDAYYHLVGDKRDRAYRDRIFSLMCLQRNLKAAGTFGYQAAIRNNPGYLRFIPVLKQHLMAECTRMHESSSAGINRLPHEKEFREIIERIFE